ncbi:MAG: glycosyltransferase family 2 protein, partial [Patescibacteria group bacterium]
VMSKLISVIIPAYNEEENVAELHRRLVAVLGRPGLPFEIIVVENGSTDRTFEVLQKLSPIKIVRMRKNFRQSGGTDAGIAASRGDVIVTMDADLQNDPEDIPVLLAKLKEGFDVVVGWRRERHDPILRRIRSRFANMITKKLSGITLHDHGCGLKAYRREILGDGVTLYGEMHVFLPAYLALSRGAKVGEVVVRHHERRAGVTKHNFLLGVKAVSDLLTLKFLSTHLQPLLVFSGLAFLSFAAGAASVAVAVVLRFRGVYFSQTPLPVLATLFVLVGFILVMMGFLAELMLRIYYDVRRAKPYSVKEVIEK